MSTGTQLAATATTFAKHVTVDEVTGCHLWTASRDRLGYGYTRVGRRVARAHRVAWEAVHGPIPPGLVVCHRCDNPSCVNVEHLFIGTHADNQRDKCRKGRQARGERNGRSKLTVEDVVDIRRRLAAGEGRSDIARAYGVDPAAIRSIATGKNWSHVTGEPAVVVVSIAPGKPVTCTVEPAGRGAAR